MSVPKDVRRVQDYLAKGKDYRRWRLIQCFMNRKQNTREKKAEQFIRKMQKLGYKAKIYAPLPQHKTSGHIHIVVLCTFNEKCRLMGILTSRRDPREIVDALTELKKVRGYIYVTEPNGPNPDPEVDKHFQAQFQELQKAAE